MSWHDYTQHGPLITVTFKTAQGLVPGQTQVKYKNVTLGTVENVHLAEDMSHVTASIRMTASAKPLLNGNARFWVVRPELNTFNASDLETLATGSYIQVEPGQASSARNHFTGLENPPAERAGEPGKVFIIKTDRLGAINPGSPVSYRDINVGQVLGYEAGNGFDPISVTLFIREPYDQYVRPHTRFWNASGISVAVGPNGLHLEMHSLRTVLAGGISFYTPEEAQSEAPAEAKSVYDLYDNSAAAEDSTHTLRIPYLAYFRSSMKDLGIGAPVMIYGIRVGQVTNVKLTFDALKATPRARVAFVLEPDLAFGKSPNNADKILRKLVAQGMRVKIESSNFLTGQKMLVLEFAPQAKPAPLVTENHITILPSSGSSDDVMAGLSDVVSKLNSIPFEEIGNNLNHLLKIADKTIAGPDMQRAMHQLFVAMDNAADLSRKADTNMTPALQRLPALSTQLQQAVEHANNLLSGLDAGYGNGSDFQRDSKRVLDQVNDASRSIRLLADYLERHPEALLRGKPTVESPEP